MDNQEINIKYEDSVSSFIKNHSMATDAKNGDVFYTIPFAFKKISDNVFQQIPIPTYHESHMMKVLILKMKERIENNDPYYEEFFEELHFTEKQILQTIK